ncbi:ATP-grasp domain-containing protein [Rhabdaerophilum sp. SD176]|uniref:ATP-grasp domain-containing protein n=1 Tax=Rhabdaerophilum sp. SD176 TaxID=2983548 RepID=UPI0024DFB6DD|nr:ATP-grasp domain-containing protein [Rhabdaerophilum sp. SD176]
MSAPTVLITLGRLPKALDVARSFASLGCKVVVAEPFARHLTGVSRSVAKSVVVRPPSAGKRAYLEDLARVVQEEAVDIVIPISEETMHVSFLRDLVPETVTIFTPPPGTLLPLYDKYGFTRLCAAYGVRTPETHRLGTPEAAGLAARNKVVVKPIHSCGGRGVRILPAGSAVPEEDVPCVVQRFVDGEIYSSCAIAHEGRIVGNIIYRGRMFQGSVAILFERVEEARIADWITRFVAASGHTGFISFDLILDAEGEVWGIECNPRTTSGLHFFENRSIAAAVLEGLPAVPRAETRLQQFYSVLTVLSGVMFRRGYFSVMQQLLGTRDVTWSWRDPMPALSMTWTTWPIIRLAIDKGVPFSEVATLDVGWFEGETPSV